MTSFLASVSYALLIISAVGLLAFYRQREMMGALYGAYRLQACQAITTELGYKSKRILALTILKWLALGIGGVGFIAHLLSENPWSHIGDAWFPLLLLMLGCIQLAVQDRPGVVIVLGSSDSKSVQIHRRLSEVLFPHRTISLLESDGVGTRIPGDCFRTLRDQDWRGVVRGIERASLLIVVDMRETTKNIDEELAYITEENLQFKTILLISEETILPDTRLEECKKVFDLPTLYELAERCFSSSGSLPSDVNPVKSRL